MPFDLVRRVLFSLVLITGKPFEKFNSSSEFVPRLAGDPRWMKPVLM